MTFKRFKKENKDKKTIARQFLIFFRWTIIIGCFIFVVIGWRRSGRGTIGFERSFFDFLLGVKYFSYETSTTIVKNESERFVYPSISICPGFKTPKAHIGKTIIKPAYLNGQYTYFDELDFDALIEPHIWKRDELFQVFSHDKEGDLVKGAQILKNDSYWQESIPHVRDTGVCYTYNPPFDSKPGLAHGIRVGIHFANSSALDQTGKEDLLRFMKIFFHRGPLFYSLQDNRPHHWSLDMSQIQFAKENQIELQFKSYTAMSHEDRPCISDPSYDQLQCVEGHFSRDRRGCQVPWYSFDDLDIPKCNNLSFVVDEFSRRGYYFFQMDQTNYDLGKILGCPEPCTTARWSYEITYKPMNPKMKTIDGQSDWILVFWFRNFFFQYEKEYLVCDYTCLIGEIGGNLGFFLGGSVLLYLDILINPMVNRFI